MSTEEMPAYNSLEEPKKGEDKNNLMSCAN